MNMKRLCTHMDISLEDMRRTGATLKDFKEYPYCYVIFILKYRIRKSYDIQYRNSYFLGGGGGGGAYWKGALIKYFEPQEGRLFEGWRLFEAGR